MGDPHTERAMCAPTAVRDVTVCQQSDWRLDPVLQSEASPSGAENENTGSGLCRGRLVMQKLLGHYRSTKQFSSPAWIRFYHGYRIAITF